MLHNLAKSKLIIPQATPSRLPWFFFGLFALHSNFFFVWGGGHGGLIVFCLNKFVNEHQLRDANGSGLESAGPSRS